MASFPSSHQFESTVPTKSCANVDAIVHLSGESLAKGRLTEVPKKSFYSSRVSSTKNLATAATEAGVETFIAASAVGIFGDRGDEQLTANSKPGSDFLAQLCVDWEAQTKTFTGRAAAIRLGLVLSESGGALAEMQKVFELGVGCPLGSGDQWMGWIHIDDVVAAIIHTLKTKLTGPINFVAPEPVRNSELLRSWQRLLRLGPGYPLPVLD